MKGLADGCKATTADESIERLHTNNSAVRYQDVQDATAAAKKRIRGL